MKKKFLEILKWLKTFIILFMCMTLVRTHIVTSVKVKGTSMYPTYDDGDHIVVWEFGYTPDLFDNIVFNHSEGSEDSYYIKRVVGLPGQSIRYENNQLYIDDVAIEEHYLNETQYPFPYTQDFTLQDICMVNVFDNCQVIPDGYYLVLGDNRLISKDSRIIGLVSKEQILGHAIYDLSSWKH